MLMCSMVCKPNKKQTEIAKMKQRYAMNICHMQERHYTGDSQERDSWAQL